MGPEWMKRYMSDNSQFRDVLRKWILSANTCCDDNTANIADHETRIVALESAGGGSGDVVGPASAADNRLATFDGTTGKLIQDGGVGIDAVVLAISQAAESISRGKVVALDIGNSFL
jgi:hypothetical protein